MSARIHLQNEAQYPGDPQPLRAAARAALEVCSAPPAELTVVLADEHTVQELNRQFAGRPHPTDVLAFPSDEKDPDSGLPYLGDVIIALPVARRQAQERGHSLEQELALLVVHGTLHLLGYDHRTLAERGRMAELQRRALTALGLPAVDGWET